MKPKAPSSKQVQHVYHDTLPWLISFSLDSMRVLMPASFLLFSCVACILSAVTGIQAFDENSRTGTVCQLLARLLAIAAAILRCDLRARFLRHLSLITLSFGSSVGCF